jgi:hypothetical protein
MACAKASIHLLPHSVGAFFMLNHCDRHRRRDYRCVGHIAKLTGVFSVWTR